MVFKLVHPLKAFFPIIVIPELIVTEDTWVTFLKKSLEIVLVSLLITKFTLLHPVKANELMVEILLEIVTFFKAIHPLNVFSPILATVLGIIILIRLLQH